MNKRGQIFLIAAVVIIILIITMTATYNTYHEEVALEDFEGLSNNYEIEAPKVINKALLEGEGDIKEKLDEFTEKFKLYAHEKDPNFGIIYIYTDTNGNTHIYNGLTGKEIQIEYSSEARGKKTTVTLLSSDTTSQGEICLEGLGSMGCVKAETEVSNFGENLYAQNLSEDVNFICIYVEGMENQGCEEGAPNAIPLGGFKSVAQSEGEVNLPLFSEDSAELSEEERPTYISIKYPDR